MNFGRIVEDSFSFAWRYKSLWIFGLFAGSGSSFNVDWGGGEFNNPEAFSGFSVDEIWAFILPILAAVIILGVIMFALHLICSPALVDAINKIARGGTYKFSESYSRGLDFFFRKLGLTVIFIAAILGVMLVSFLPVLVLSFFGLLLLFPMVIAGLFFAITIYALAERAMVVRDSSIGDAIDEAYVLMKQNFTNCLLIALIFIGLSFGVAIVLLSVAAMLYFPVNMIVESITANRSLVLILGVILGLPIGLVVGGFTGTFFHSLYTLFYFGLVDPESPYVKKAMPAPAAPAAQ